MTRKLMATLGMSAMLLTGGGMTANADPIEEPRLEAQLPHVEIQQVSDPICEEIREVEVAREGAKSPDASVDCKATETLRYSDAKVVTPEIARAHGDPLTPTGERLSEVAASRTVYYQNWTQDRRGLYYINWYEKHKGLYYYDGQYAWVSPRYGWDAHGYHRCDLGYGIGYDIKVNYCGERGNMTSKVIAEDEFRVHLIWKGIPIFASHSMAAGLPKGGL